MKHYLAAFLIAASSPLAGQALPAQLPIPDPKVAAIRNAALSDDYAWDIVEGLTTEVGQRLAGTEAEARARQWAVTKLKALGFANVHVEPFTMPVWVRGIETAEIVAPFPQKLVLTALGNSGATSPGGLTGEIVAFDSIDSLRAAPDAAVRGKIVFVDHRMMPTQDGSGYGQFGAPRRQGPTIASNKGAIAIVVRSIGTDHHRNPHTGVQVFSDGAKPIPAAALTVPDAEQLVRILARGKPVTMHLTLTPRFTGEGQSGNVVADVPGRDPNAPKLLIGGHLDSWDLGTGAIDDGAGVAITAAAAKRVMDAGRPLRTIRIVWFGAEEPGGFGGEAYLKAHPGDRYTIVGESDFGTDRIWRMGSKLSTDQPQDYAMLAATLAPLGIVKNDKGEADGTDVGPMVAAGAPWVTLNQDGMRYFDIHHTPDDTLDKIDREGLHQNVAAWTAMLAVLSGGIETPPKPRRRR
ncbi:MAG: M20/M25/M40 family metallo-hydrolase [Sphingomicrobium sp.]